MDSNRNEQLLLPSHIGEGTIRRFIPRTDIEVIVSNYTMNRERTISLQTEAAMVELQYCLQGTREVSIAGERNEIIPGICSLQLIRQADAKFEFTGNTTSIWLVLVFRFTRFITLWRKVMGREGWISRSYLAAEIMGVNMNGLRLLPPYVCISCLKHP